MQEQQSEFEVVEKKPKNKTLIAVIITAAISVFVSFAVFCTILLCATDFGKFILMEAMLKTNYYGEVNTDELYDGAMAGFIAGTGDKYAAYYDADASEDRTLSLGGTARGIGIVVVYHPDTENIYIRHVYDDCPARKAGLKEGDQIVAIDGVKVTKTGYAEAVNSIVREIGDTVELDLLRDGKELTLTVTYAEFTYQSVFTQMLDGNVAYVRITTFNGETPEQFKNAVTDMMNKGAEAFIFDLRKNGGGTVDAVTEMVDFLCPEGDIMTVKYANGRTEVIAASDKNEIDLPMAVLTDGGTASASELFAASIRDFGKGITVGSKTYGKGVMQSTFFLPDGSSAVFTVGEFFPHSGKSFNGKGVPADVEVTLTEEQAKYENLTPPDRDPVVLAATEKLS